jgi:energy-coupling factor transporter ATP-binding protein EcfA2
MKLHNIKAENFLSLRHCRIDKLDLHRNFLVGPNGSGKTTVFRLLRMVRDVIAEGSTGRRPALSQLCTRGIFPPAFDVSINVEFDMPWEQDLLVAFLCTALSQPTVLNMALSQLQSQANIQLPRDQYLFFAEWLSQNIRPETVPFFFRGDLRVTYRGEMYEYLRLSFTFLCKGEPVTILIGSLSGTDGTFWRGDPPEVLTNGPAGGDALLKSLWNPRMHKGPDEGGPLFEFFNYQPGSEPAALDVEEFFLFLADQRGFLQIEPVSPQYAILPLYSTLSRASGIDFSQAGGRRLTFGFLLSLLFQRATVFTNNVRSPFSTPIRLDVNEVMLQQINLDDEQQIPLWLLRLKNGDTTEQARFRRIQETFRMLIGDSLSFDLTVKLIPQQLPISTPSQLPTLDIRVIDTEGDISLAYEGAGIWEALVLSTLLDESEGRLVLLDEPAANLHPGMQYKLLEVLRSAPGQVIIVTHSAHLLPIDADEFHCVYRMQKDRLETRISSLGKTFSSQEDKLENELRASRDLASLLFADGALLVEGATEIGAFGEWFLQSTASQGKTFADRNLVLHAVGGKAEFPFYLRFLSAFGVPWVVICDGDALPLNKDKNRLLWNVLKELRLIAQVPSTTASFEMLKAVAAQARVYTYKTASPITFETIPEVKNYLDMQWTPSGKTTFKGRYIAQHLGCPQVVDEILLQATNQLIG